MVTKLALRRHPCLQALTSFFRLSSSAYLAFHREPTLARSRTLLYYIDSLLLHFFIASAGCSKGQAISSQSISKWAVQGISLCYHLAPVSFPFNINLALPVLEWHLPPVSEKGPISEICQVMTWGNPLTFFRLCMEDVTARVHSSFGRAVL